MGVEPRPQCSACFINSVQDNMGSIMDLAKTEAMLFKYGSGAGVNLSPIRGSKERMSGGGIASGPVSFMKGFDAFAGVVKSGGTTRRAAKMVILDADHPDVLDFIDSKANEEKKAWALIEQGYDAVLHRRGLRLGLLPERQPLGARDGRRSCAPSRRTRDWTTHDGHDRRARRHLQGARHLPQDGRGRLDLRRPGHPVRHDHQRLAHQRQHGSDLRRPTRAREYMFLNDTACNLASLNLMKFVRDDGEFDVEAYRYAARVTITAQEILVDNASYPTPQIEENSHRFRPLGLGYANLGALLMSRGLAYDSDEGRAYAAALTAIMTGEAYRQSAVVARDHGGPFLEYKNNEQPFLRVIASTETPRIAIPACAVRRRELIDAARSTWDAALELGTQLGYRNAQVTVLAPTGTIAFMMDCDTTGIEPDIALDQVQEAGRRGLPQDRQQDGPVGAQEARLHARSRSRRSSSTSTSARRSRARPALKPEHLTVFDCAFKPVNGERSIHYMGHVRMMGATQPFLSGAISKTVNMPEAATAEEIEDVYLEGWKLGLKAIAIYRDGSKRSQPLSTGKKKDKEARRDCTRQARRRRRLSSLGSPSHTGAACRTSGARSRTSSRSPATRATSRSGCTRMASPARSSSRWPRKVSTVSGLMDSLATMTSHLAPVRRAAARPGQQVRPRAVRAGRLHRQPGDPDRQVDRGLRLPLAGLALPVQGRAGRARHHQPGRAGS